MNKDDKINFTLRMNDELNSQVTKEAKRLGITKNALINIMLRQELEKTGA